MKQFYYYGKSDRGKIRKGNEDYFYNGKIGDDEYLFIIADGMGGHKAGEVASKLGTEIFIEHYKKLRQQKQDIEEAMDLSLKQANNSILKKAQGDPSKRGMGTTFSAILLKNNEAYVIHVGDSRIYLIRENKIKRITKDHTFVEKMVEEGRISELEARDHPQKNILYMSLGARENFTPDVVDKFDVQEGDIFFMCSDGLNSMVPDNFIKDYATSYEPDSAVEKLIEMANSNGGTDNITIQIIRVSENIDHNKTEPIVVKKKIKVVLYVVILAALFVLYILYRLFLGK